MWWVAATFIGGSFVQTAVGFGLALVIMPVLVTLVGIRTATPLLALVSSTLGLYLIYRYRAAVSWADVKYLLLGNIFGTPLGVWGLATLDADGLTTALGVLVVAYALYTLAGAPLPTFEHPAWAVVMGFLSGLIGGAYSTGGPPVVVYGAARKWPPLTFKGNLQTYFTITGLIALVSHFAVGNMSWTVAENYGWALPGVLVGIVAGTWVEKRVNAVLFERLVLVVLVVLGVRLISG